VKNARSTRRAESLPLECTLPSMVTALGPPLYHLTPVESPKTFASSADVMKQVERLMFDVLRRDIFEIEDVLNDFFTLVQMSGLNITTLYRLYVGKNVLNQFRQEHGYKEGNYIKIWNGKEDNVVMKRIWEKNGELKPEALHRELKKQYALL